MNVEEKKKRGRRPKDERVKYQLNNEQTKFVVDLGRYKKGFC